MATEQTGAITVTEYAYQLVMAIGQFMVFWSDGQKLDPTVYLEHMSPEDWDTQFTAWLETAAKDWEGKQSDG